MKATDIAKIIARSICEESPEVAFSECCQAVEENLDLENQDYSQEEAINIINEYLS